MKFVYKHFEVKDVSFEALNLTISGSGFPKHCGLCCAFAKFLTHRDKKMLYDKKADVRRTFYFGTVDIFAKTRGKQVKNFARYGIYVVRTTFVPREVPSMKGRLIRGALRFNKILGNEKADLYA